MKKTIEKALILALALSLLFAGCNSEDEAADEASRFTLPAATEAAKEEEPAPEEEDKSMDAASYSTANGMSFEYPAGWEVTESNSGVSIISPAETDCAIIVADISYEVSLFLAGHGDMESSIDALVIKHANGITGGSVKENYNYTWDQREDGSIQAKASFAFTTAEGLTYECLVDVEQVGSRVFLSLVLSPTDERRDTANTVYQHLNGTFSAEGTDGTLEPADLTALGFPYPPDGFYDFYSPVTGQYFIYPDDWNMVNNVHDDSVILFNDEGALMLTENWTDKFFAEYNSNGQDVEACFSLFLDECAGALEQIYGEVPAYHDFQLMATENQELIKATFNYTVSEGTGRCFAELGVREFDGKEYVQATLCLYRIGDSYSIDLFSIIMDSIQIYYPEL